MKGRLDTRKEKTRTSGGCSCATHQPSPPLPRPSDHHRGGIETRAGATSQVLAARLPGRGARLELWQGPGTALRAPRHCRLASLQSTI